MPRNAVVLPDHRRDLRHPVGPTHSDQEQCPLRGRLQVVECRVRPDAEVVEKGGVGHLLQRVGIAGGVRGAEVRHPVHVIAIRGEIPAEDARVTVEQLVEDSHLLQQDR